MAKKTTKKVQKNETDFYDNRICDNCGKKSTILYREKGVGEWYCEKCFYE